jgi:hypothetical protein
VSDPREQIASALAGFLTPEQAKTLIDEVLATTKKGRAQFNCKKCGQLQIQFADMPDARAVTSAITDLMNQGFGRPVEANVQNVEPIKFVRLTDLGELEGLTGSKPDPKVRRNTKVRKGEVTRQAGSASRRKTAVDKPLQ